MRGLKFYFSIMIVAILLVLFMPISFAAEWPEQGAVYVTKDAIGTSTDGRYLIELEVMGKNIETTSDVVLVLDDSGSMEGSTSEMKEAARSFVSNLLENDDTNTYIAIISINGSGTAGEAGVLCDYSNDIDTLYTAINGISVVGGTNLHGGLWEARKLMETSSADNKSVIIMSDGDPTYSYQPEYQTKSTFQPLYSSGTTPNWSPDEITLDDVEFLNQVDYNDLIGDGDSYEAEVFSVTYKASDGNTKEYILTDNHGTQTIYEAGLIKDQGINVYSVGFKISEDSNAADVLKACSSDNSYYYAPSGQLMDVFSAIGTKIYSAASDVEVTDPMSDYVALEIDGTEPTWAVGDDPSLADVVVTLGEVTFEESDDGKYTILWSIPTISEAYEEDGVTPKGETLMYYVNVLPELDPVQTYPTNKDTVVEYTDVDGVEGVTKTGYSDGTEGDFTIPVVSGGKGVINVVYYRVNEQGLPVNSLGETVPSSVQAQQITAFRIVRNGSEALDVPGTFEINPHSSWEYNDTSYFLHDDFGSISVSLTEQDNIKTVYFGYCPRFEIIWQNDDGEVLETDTYVPYGQVPEYNGDVPIKEETAEGIYTFVGWNPEVSEATEDVTYVAEYSVELKSYTVRWVDWDDNLLEEDLEVVYGTMPSYNGQTPTRDTTSEYIYTFYGWNPQVSEVVGDITYKAEYSNVLKTYNVRWLNWNNELLEQDSVPYGQIPSYNGQTPTRDSTDEYTYTFSGWSPAVSEVMQDTAYIAMFNEYEKPTDTTDNDDSSDDGSGDSDTGDDQSTDSNDDSSDTDTSTDGTADSDNNSDSSSSSSSDTNSSAESSDTDSSDGQSTDTDSDSDGDGIVASLLDVFASQEQDDSGQYALDQNSEVYDGEPSPEPQPSEDLEDEIEFIEDGQLPRNAPGEVIKKFIWWPLLLLLLLLLANNEVITYYDNKEDGEFKKRKRWKFRFKGDKDEPFISELKHMKSETFKVDVMIRKGLAKRISKKNVRLINILLNEKILKSYEVSEDVDDRIEFSIVFKNKVNSIDNDFLND